MGAFLIAFNTVLPLFLIIIAGFLFSKTKAASAYWIDVLNKFALLIGLPALVIDSLTRIEISGGPVKELVIINSLYIAGCIFMAYPASRLFGLSNLQRRTLFLVFAYGNVAYLGIPVLQGVFGEDILPVAAILSAVYLFWLLTLGQFLTEMHGEAKLNPSNLIFSLLKNPLLLSVFIGITIAVLKLSIPDPISKAINLFAGSVTAVVLFSLGIFLGYQNKGGWREWGQAAFFAGIIMMVFPAVFWLILRSTGFSGTYMQASILDAAMPLGLTSYALTQQYRLDTPFAARLVVVTTISSILILPLWITLLGT